MNIITLDFETFFSDDYMLKKMMMEAYIRDPRFEAHGAAVRYPKYGTRWFSGTELIEALQELPWEETVCLCHHAQFDGFILSHHYGIKPACWLDTLSMFRLVHPSHLSASLDNVRQVYGLPSKRTPYEKFKGRHWHELSLEVQQEIATGSCDEVESIWRIFNEMMKTFPHEELPVIDATIRMFTEPVLEADIELLGKVWSDEARAKARKLRELALDERDLQSNELFASLLRAEGVEAETKAGKNGAIYAFAKTDSFMQDLLEHEDEHLRALAEARLGVKSTIDQTRAERLGWMASRGAMPVYLAYAGAHTTRWSGGDKVNWQNFRRGGLLRKSIKAPEGFKLAKIDLSQIECRILNYVAGQWDKIEEFRSGKDPYVGVASAFYGFPVTKLNHPGERQAGKVVELQAGYGSGGPKIAASLRRADPPILITDEEGTHWRDAYRDTHPAVVELWREAGQRLSWLNGGLEGQWGPVKIKNHRIWLPNGAPLIYDTLEWHEPSIEEIEQAFTRGVPDWKARNPHWRFRVRKGWAIIHGAYLVENLIQALARVIISQAMLRLRAHGIRTVLTEHDSLVFLVDNDKGVELYEWAKREVCRSPTWMPDIPIDCEGVLDERYS